MSYSACDLVEKIRSLLVNPMPVVPARAGDRVVTTAAGFEWHGRVRRATNGTFAPYLLFKVKAQ